MACKTFAVVLVVAWFCVPWTLATAEYWKKDKLVVFRDPEVSDLEENVAEDILKIYSYVGPENLVSVDCDGVRKTLRSHQSFAFAVIKEGVKWSSRGHVVNKAVHCNLALTSSNGTNTKIVEAIPVDLDLYVYDYGFGNYGGFLGLWTYLGRW